MVVLDAQVATFPCNPLRGSRTLVYRGIITQAGTKVAIKNLWREPPKEEASIEHIVREVTILTQLGHENITRVFGVMTSLNLTLSIVVEWIEGGNAIDHVRNRIFDPRPLLIDIAKGLCYLHDQPLAVIHGDLRGKNILIAADGRAVITDYGLSSFLTSHLSTYVSPTCDAGLTDMVRWVSPEIMRGDGGVSVEGDIWSFGMTMLELFTAQPPFHNIRRLRELFCRILQGPPDRPSDFVTCSRMTDA
ncbi:hypothetical protein ID866_6720 [Astraeus odoratus]|nr:hypothetical protein ID866_6720 [Astraeus odoratus]